LLPRLGGRRRAARYFLLGEPFGAEEGREFGLVSHVIPNGGLDAALKQMVDRLLAKPAEALRLTQKLLRRGNVDEIVERMELENSHFTERLTSDEVRQAITSFFARKAASAQTAR
jgi:enoyl-CoA hydratase/carnithine racemase